MTCAQNRHSPNYMSIGRNIDYWDGISFELPNQPPEYVTQVTTEQDLPHQPPEYVTQVTTEKNLCNRVICRNRIQRIKR